MAQMHAPAHAADLRTLRAALALSRERMARLLDVSWKTVERIEAAASDGAPPRLPASRMASVRLAEIQEIVELGLLVFTREGFAHFMSTPLPTFGGLTALQMIELGRASEVLGALATTYEGAPT
jgi:DNA-binding XRE family transcriptional regulator